MPRSRAIVWMDSHEASVFRFGIDQIKEAALCADKPDPKVNHKAGAMRAGRPAADFDFFDRVIDALRGTCLWYLTGPDGTKQELVDYLDKYRSRDGPVTSARQDRDGPATESNHELIAWATYLQARLSLAVMDGGSGQDTAVFDGDASAFEIQRKATRCW
jgi:hypothetical protein